MKRVLAASPSAFAETIGGAFAGAAHDAVARARMLGVEVADGTPRTRAKPKRAAKKKAKQARKAPKRTKRLPATAASRAKASRRKKAAPRKRA